jgi:hypothetical protein
MIDPVASLSIPLAHGLVHADAVRRTTEIICLVVVEVGVKFINQPSLVML